MQLPTQLINWMRENPELLGWLGLASAVMFLFGLVLVPLVVVRMPDDFFLHPVPGPESWRSHHPVLRILIRTAKNLLGTLLILIGVLLLALPGQGILAILLGVSMLEFPGKRRLEVYIVTRKTVSGSMNWIRARAGKAPLRLPRRGP